MALWLSLIACLLICLLFANIRNPFLLRNLFIFYSFAIYNIAPIVLGASEAEYLGWLLEFVIVLAIFMAGYIFGLRWARRRRGQSNLSNANKQGNDGHLNAALLILFLANTVFLLLTILSYGVAEFYAGAQLVAMIQDYGKANAGGAIVQVVTFALGTATSAGLYVLVERTVNVPGGPIDVARQRNRTRLALRLSFIWLLLFPVLQFSRSALVFGSLTFLSIWSRFARKSFAIRVVLLGLLALGFFVYIGLTRAESLGSRLQVESLFISELTPWAAYRDIKTNIEQLGYQNGRTLFLPFLLRVVPRGLFPNKPQNSAGYYMSMLFPDLFAKGFVIAPTYMGALYLNFGMLGVLAGTFLFGIFSGRIDGIVIYRQFRRIGLFFLVFAIYLSLLRNDPAGTMFDLLISILVYFTISRWAWSKDRPAG